MMDDQQTPPQPGWYPHPTMPGTQAYWDGDRWTDHVAPAAPPRDGSTSAAAKVFLLLAAGAAIVLMAWIADAIVKSTG